MSELRDLKLDGEIKLGESTFTRLVGGFNENTPILSDLQIGSLLEYKHGVKQVRENINRNREVFKDTIHILDLKDSNYNNSYDNLKILHESGYSKQSITQSNNIYMLSQEGFNLYLQISDINKSYEDFENLYFGKTYINTVVPMRYEKSFGNILDKITNGLMVMHRQYSVLNYRIDFYCEEFKLAIEYDEGHHNYNKYKDYLREIDIIKELDCEFIRVKKGEELEGINRILNYVFKKNIHN